MCVGVLQQKQKDFDKNWYKLNIKMTAKDVFVEKIMYKRACLLLSLSINVSLCLSTVA